MKFKGNLKTKRTQKITSKEPTNIFDFNRPSKVIDFNKLIKTTPPPSSKPLKIIDFNKMILTQTKSKNLEINEIKNPVKRKKIMKVKFVDFDEMMKKNEEVKDKEVNERDKGGFNEEVKDKEEVKVDNKAEDKVKEDIKNLIKKDLNNKDTLINVNPLPTKEILKVIPCLTVNPKPLVNPLPIVPSLPLLHPKPLVTHKNFVNRVLSSLEDGSTITDLIKIYIKEKKKTSKSLYLHNLGENIDNNSILIEDIDLNKEIERLDKQIENIEIQDKLWKKIRESSFRDNTFYLKNENKENYENFKDKNQIDLKIKEKINKLKFIKESLNLNIKKVKSKVQEEEEKIFKLTENENKLDTMVLLKAITRS